MLLLTPLWPAYGEACRRRDVRWIRKNLSFSLWLVCGSILVLGAVLFWQGDTLMQWWLGRPFAGSRTIIAGMTAGFLLRAWVDCRSVVLNSAGYAREQLSYWVAQAFLHLVLSLILMRMAGVAGVAWAAPLSALLTTTWGYPLLMRTLFKRMEAGAPASNPILSRAVATSTP